MKRNAHIGPCNSTADLPSAQSAAPPIKRSFFRKFVSWMSKHVRRATTAENIETNYSTSGGFRHNCNIFLYKLVLTVLGHSAANLPSDRPATDQRATTSAVSMEMNDGTFSEFVTVITYLLYQIVDTGVGHSSANLPSDRPATPPAQSSNPAPVSSAGDQRATTSAVSMETYNTFGESYHGDNIFVAPNSSYWCRAHIGELTF
jgi:hypothetical protein